MKKKESFQVPVLIASLCFVGCQKRVEDLHLELIRKRQERTQTVSEMHRIYGGGTVAAAVNHVIDDGNEQLEYQAHTLASMMKNFVSESDRASFEEQIRVVGRGDHAIALTNKARTFFEDPGVINKSTQVVSLDYQVEQLELELRTRQSQARQVAMGLWRQ